MLGDCNDGRFGFISLDTVQMFSTVCLVIRAGLHHQDLVENYPDDKWDLLIAVMLSAPFHLTKRCLPDMKKKG